LKNREIISECINDLRALSIDEYVPKKFVHNKLKSFAAFIVKRDSDNRNLFKLAELFTTVSCVKMQKSNLAECCAENIPNCNSVMRSVSKIPKLFSTMYGYALNVTSIDGSTNYTSTTASAYSNNQRSRFPTKGKSFWIENDYLIMPDSDVSVVRVSGLFSDSEEAGKLDTCKKKETSSASSTSSGCNTTLEATFICPEYLIAAVRQETVKDLFNFYKRTQPDENPEGSENIKSNNGPQNIAG